ncbi:hypothetical protein NQ315_015092 [Exocentrus adspersus]|uniref:Major facilitator superfamily (MFS) profile domain-containing protein n=1 Tax=Exocentrus adspersus TaxID=1586481 RepID=A0AAV8VY15_9CUCU|nr:hypothetical protein NQ315_015092 [Exocentrus adspersus]
MTKYMKLFFHRILKDLKQKELLPLKLLFFMHSSTILVLYPYLTIHMRELGINVEETAIMSAVSPVIAILMPPLAGMVADKIGNFRVLLASFSVVGGGSALLLLLVPVGRITLTFPDKVILGFSCEVNESPVLSIYQEHPCTVVSRDKLLNTEIKLESCGLACQAVLNENYTKQIMETRRYETFVYDPQRNTSFNNSFLLTDEDVRQPEALSKSRNHKTLKNNVRYATAVRKLSKNSFYFPYNAINIFCDVTNDTSVDCILGSEEKFDAFKKLKDSMKVGLKVSKQDQDDYDEERQLFSVQYIESKYDHIGCTQNTSFNNKHVSVIIPITLTDTKIKHLDLSTCSSRCIATAPRKQICSNSKTTIEQDMRITFWSYLFVRVFVGIVSGTSFAMFEGAVIAILREHKADYGLQRIYATIGGMISSPISGWMIDFASKGKGYTDFRPIFFLYAALKILSGILMLFINLEFKKAATSVITDVLTVLKKIELITLFISCLVLGCAWGFIESFLFWLLEDLGGSKSLMGLTITVGGVVGIPLLVLSGPLIKKLGHANVIFVGFIFYAIRLIGYSLIYNPWLCLIFEAMESITFGLSFTAAVTYAAKLSTVTTDTSIQGMLGGLYYGVGKGVGSLIGGFLIKLIGIRSTFQSFAIGTAITGLIYFAFYHIYLKKNPSQGTDITKKDVVADSQKIEKAELAEIQADLPVVYEDAMCNPAYETTEMEDESDECRNSDNKIHTNKQNGEI